MDYRALSLTAILAGSLVSGCADRFTEATAKGELLGGFCNAGINHDDSYGNIYTLFVEPAEVNSGNEKFSVRELQIRQFIGSENCGSISLPNYQTTAISHGLYDCEAEEEAHTKLNYDVLDGVLWSDTLLVMEEGKERKLWPPEKY